MILGTVLLSATVTQAKINTLYKKLGQHLYYAESGLEEAYAVVAKKLEGAIATAKEQAQIDVDAKVQDERDKEQRLNNDSIPTNDYDSPYINDDYSINEVEVSNYYKEQYRFAFENTFNTYESEIRTILEDKNNYTTVSNLQVNLTISPFNTGTNPREFLIEFTSSFALDHLEKTINADIVIEPSDMPIKVYNLKEAFLGVPLWQYALVAGQDVFITGNKVTVKGDIYAYGTPDKSSQQNVDIINYNGIVIGSNSPQKSGNLDVTGNIITQSTIQTKGNASTLKVKSGNILCSSLAAQGENTTIKIGDVGDPSLRANVFTKDDIELNGTGSNIHINGSYYGFSKGADTTVGHDSSSSILINIPPYDLLGNQVFGLSGNGSIHITGETNPYIEYSTMNKNGIYIGGTSHIYFKNNDGAINDDYTTGESVSVKGNYFAYSVKMDEGPYNQANIQFDTFVDKDNAIDLATGFASASSSTDFTLAHKRGYFKEVMNTPPYQMLINTGKEHSVVSIPKNKIIFAAGLSTYEDDDNGSYGDPNAENDITANVPTYYHNYIAYMANKVNTKFTGNPIINYFSFTENIDDSEENKIVFVNNTTGNLWLKSSGSANSLPITPDRTIDVSTYNQGLIITKQDIYITGALDFEGAIITTGNIYIMDSKEKNMTYNESLLIEIIREDPILRSQFMNGYDVKISESTVTSTDQNIRLDGFIDIRNWRLSH